MSDFYRRTKTLTFLPFHLLHCLIHRLLLPTLPPFLHWIQIPGFTYLKSCMHSGSWHNRYPGDSRIVLDLTGLVSLYDIGLAPSLVSVRAGIERWDHRVLGISSSDISNVMSVGVRRARERREGNGRRIREARHEGEKLRNVVRAQAIIGQWDPSR
ncbi:hypothetical protein BDR07DRAFT_1432670 [Suillus spraguei]|nr:hypothetical protein BDR07DRAFT_1432670 [Suillus spraguei]